jgi:hypothetical protein
MTMFVIELAVRSPLHWFATFAAVMHLLYRLQYMSRSGKKCIASVFGFSEKVA